MKSMFKSVFTFGVMALGLSSTASALSLDWTGRYRFEALQLDSTTLATPVERKSYALHNLVLSPRIIAADGIEVVGQLSFLGNNNYPGSMVGQPFGGGNRPTGASRVMNRNAGSAAFDVRQLYMNINQEFGQIVVGRAPIDFGLGITYNGGSGLFDHWGDTHDMVGYKFLIGNLSFMPIISKPYDYSVAQGQDVTDLMIEVMYDNKETESQFGIMHSTRTASTAANDLDTTLGTGTKAGNYSVQNINLFIGRGWEHFKFKIEAGFTDGKTGINLNNNETKANGYGVVLDLAFPRENSVWDWHFRGGVVSGDNPQTDNFEGYALNRNYDVGFLMFNHPLGKYDIFSTNFQRNRNAACTTAPCSAYANEEALDEEAISNTIFLNPSLTYSFGERWSWKNSLVYAQLQANSSKLAGNTPSKDVGFEWDTAVIYKPNSRFTWINEAGLLFPGAAWKEGSVNNDSKFTFGIHTKAAISF